MKPSKLTVTFLTIAAIGVAILMVGCTKAEKPVESKTVAIATLMTHPALDAVQENLKKELGKEGYVEGQNVRYLVRNANGQVQLAANIASELASQNADAIVAVTTPMAQAVAKASRSPLV